MQSYRESVDDEKVKGGACGILLVGERQNIGIERT